MVCVSSCDEEIGVSADLRVVGVLVLQGGLCIWDVSTRSNRNDSIYEGTHTERGRGWNHTESPCICVWTKCFYNDQRVNKP